MIKELITPCLILDQDIFENNINKIKNITSKRKLIFRPHLKTAKSKEIAKISSKEFGHRAMVSTIEEIEQLQNCGINLNQKIQIQLDGCGKQKSARSNMYI